MFIIENEKRNQACKELQRKFSERFVGLQLIWSYIDRNSKEVQKFRLVDSISGHKLRLVFISNESFEDGTIESFLSKFEDTVEQIMGDMPGNIYYKKARLSIKEQGA